MLNSRVYKCKGTQIRNCKIVLVKNKHVILLLVESVPIFSCAQKITFLCVCLFRNTSLGKKNILFLTREGTNEGIRKILDYDRLNITKGMNGYRGNVKWSNGQKRNNSKIEKASFVTYELRGTPYKIK